MRIGILGAGQLSRMLALSALPMGFEFVFYAEKFTDSVMHLGDFIKGSYTDYEALTQFANQSDVVTFENENIPYQTIEFIESLKPVYPGSFSLKLTQDKLFEKELFSKLSIPTPSYRLINSKSDIQDFAKLYEFPFFIKKRLNGYDGKGLIKINSENELLNINQHFLNQSICEQYVRYDREISMIAVRSTLGERKYYDICENTHHDGILIKTSNILQDPIYSKAREYIDLVIDSLNFIGCIAFEFFQVGNSLLANEIAPRVHNSGHWTIEGAFTSQFENHIRAISSLPLGSTLSRHNATMFNIIGNMPDKIALLKNDSCYIHDYKKEGRPGRKIGHYTIIAELN